MQEETAVTIRTAYGPLVIDTVRDGKMATALSRGEYPTEGLVKLARRFTDEQSVVLDIGAHIGTFSVPIAASVRAVISFEPAAEARAMLTRNAGAGTNIDVRAIALGREPGSGTIVVRNAANAGANTLVRGGAIPVRTLDAEVERADFIKIDVEGMELEVLGGGEALIERSRPVVFFEVNLSQLRAHGTAPRSLERFFKERGYALYFPFGEYVARVRSATLVTALVAPRAWLTHADSAPFDLLAVPIERALPIPCRSSFWLAVHLIRANISAKMARLRRIFSHR